MEDEWDLPLEGLSPEDEFLFKELLAAWVKKKLGQGMGYEAVLENLDAVLDMAEAMARKDGSVGQA